MNNKLDMVVALEPTARVSQKVERLIRMDFYDSLNCFDGGYDPYLSIFADPTEVKN